MRLAVIPARGGSKRIPRKNIKNFFGKPMIAWSIQQAVKSGAFDRIIVSTDDAEIAQISKTWGAEIPFMRPKELSDDFTGTTSVIAHAINWFIKEGYNPLEVCCIYATAPLIQVEYILKGLDALRRHKADFSFSVTPYAFPIQRAIKLCEKGRVEMMDQTQFQIRSQDLTETYHDAGQFYWGSSKAWQSEKPIFGKHSVPVIIPRYLVQDIDTHEDWMQAELMFNALNL
jgi:pseudaminic acid cytidylyltransferase